MNKYVRLFEDSLPGSQTDNFKVATDTRTAVIDMTHPVEDHKPHVVDEDTTMPDQAADTNGLGQELRSNDDLSQHAIPYSNNESADNHFASLSVEELEQRKKDHIRRKYNMKSHKSERDMASKIITTIEAELEKRKKKINERISDDSYERRHYSYIKDIDEPRPKRMAPRPNPDGMRDDWRLYLQDLASDVMIDKYGLQKGHKLWEDSIGMGARGGGMFAISATICKEKAKMLKDLIGTNAMSRDEASEVYRDYFHESYYSLWKKWVVEVMHKPLPAIAQTPIDAVVPPVQAEPITEPEVRTHDRDHEFAEPVTATAPRVEARPRVSAPAPNGSRANLPSTGTKFRGQYETKDAMRISDIVRKANGDPQKERNLTHQMANLIKDKAKLMRRYKAAIDLGKTDIANIFYDYARDLGLIESKKVRGFAHFVNEGHSHEDHEFHPTKVWRFLDSKPFNNPNFYPQMNDAHEIYDKHISNDATAMQKYIQFPFVDDGTEHPSEIKNRQRRETYDKLAAIGK